MKGPKISVGMGCICFGLMLTVSSAEITHSYFSWFSRKKLVSQILPEISDFPEPYRITTRMGSIGLDVGKMDSSLKGQGVNGTRNVTVEKRSVKRGGVEYFGDLITETAVSRNQHLGRIPNGKNYFPDMNGSGNRKRQSRYKRNADKQTKETNEIQEERKGAEAEAEYRRAETAARRKEARDEKAKNTKIRRVLLKNTRVSKRKSLNAKESGGKEKKLKNDLLIKHKSSIRKNGSKNLLNRPSIKKHHKPSPQKRKLKNKSKKKGLTCVKSKCKADVVVNRRKGSKTHITGQKMSLTKEWRKSHPGQGMQGNYSGKDDEHGSEETKKQGTGKEKQRRDDRQESDQKNEGESNENETAQKKTSKNKDKKSSVTTKNKVESTKKTSSKEVLEESEEETSSEDEIFEKESTKSSKGAKSRTKEEQGREESKSSKNTATKTKGAKTEQGKTELKKGARDESKDSTKTKKSTMISSIKKDAERSQKGSHLIQKQGNDVMYLSPVLGLGLSSRKRAHSKAVAWSRNTHKRPMTGGYASSGRLTRAYSNLHGAYASAGI